MLMVSVQVMERVRLEVRFIKMVRVKVMHMIKVMVQIRDSLG